MPRIQSCILANLNHYFRLGDDDQRLLRDLEKDPAQMRSGQPLWTADSPVDQLYIIQSGWAYSFRDNPDGGRQVVDILLPGDVAGLRELTFATHISEARMITEGVVYPFPHHRILDIMENSTPLSMALLAAFARQEAILTERLLLISQRSARARIAHFIIETHTRLNRVQPTDLSGFYLPLSQKLLGELLGLTSVHVSRSLSDMTRDGLLTKARHHIEVHDRDRLFEEADFDDRYLSSAMSGLHARVEDTA
ncbi:MULTISPECIES: Crp/Fnr family transcriptional regulator [Modicisalibacter]|uniref:Crp/Fnr family transcriptional regulator n=1 Tax=Modicisalibacter TaxID=574347 RepID=UPI00100A30E5|nr:MULTISPECIES: Crp/Fnr family transcriptional regulator [Halomonadaceae]MBZ9559616.1 Crp/Fnr family transcriptional regulator [Modicisalibacter sp. R2A 31.J]MBZ9577068.1 Crp/Fnr family transcriptional regulator [Modicisalibacter sp. MOD 31.J]